MGDDSLTLTPVYRFEWSDGTVRRTDEAVDVEEPSAVALETLAMIGREDPDCEVELISMGS